MSELKPAGSPTTGKTDHAAVPSKRYELEPPHIPTPGTVLLAFTGNLACWVITGAVGYASPSFLANDDWTCLVMGLWPPQVFAMGYLIFVALKKGRISTTPSLCAVTVGSSMTILYVVCWATWKNFAMFIFWIEASVYFSLVCEAKFRIFEAAERRMGTLLDF